MLELKETNHSYYCSSENCYNNRDSYTFDSWTAYKNEWVDYNLQNEDDYNHIFRFDIRKDEETNTLYLELFYMQQRKGRFLYACVNNIQPEDMEEINTFLKARWQYLKQQWAEFSSDNS